MESEQERLKSFEKNEWDCTAVSPQDLAKAGLYFLRGPDKVRCFQCNGELEGWSPGDSPSDEHKKYYPHCMFINQNSCSLQPGNVCTSSDPEVKADTHMTQIPRYNFPVDVKKPYCSDDDRVQSFPLYWPADKPTPKDIAEAGFYYIGPNDEVKCYSCGGILDNWGPEDDPWKDHKIFYSECQYVKLNYPYVEVPSYTLM